MKTFSASVLLLIACVIAPDVRGQSPDLDWPEVTRESKPWTRWWWLGSAVEEPVLTSLLESYQQAGLGGVEITPIYGIRGEEARFIDFLSPTWMEMLSHTVAEAGRLNLGVDMATGTGWPFGGPQVDPDYAARRAIIQSYPVASGARMETPIVYPDENVDRPAELQTVVAGSAAGEIRDLTARVDAAGRLDWIAPAGEWTVYALFRGWTGQLVKRAAPGAEGLVMDHYAKEALDRYLDRFDDAFAATPFVAVRAQFNDSYEAYGADWTPRMFDEFRARRGYDLRQYLPAFAGAGPSEVIARVKSDYRETISDLILEEFTEPWTKWVHEKSSLSRNQAHGSPGNILDLYAATDIPETETFGPAGNPDNDPLIGKFASSAAHVAGRPLSSSESATWLKEHFTVTLEDLKGVVDQVFVTGINHLFFHGTVYSPPDETWPGWLFYAATELNPGNPIWRDLPTLNHYIARTQSVLQSGMTDTDILLYWPIYDNWHDSTGFLMNFPVQAPDWFYGKPFGRLAASLWERGHTFDYVSDRQLSRSRTTSDGAIQTPGAAYRVIVVPFTEHMPVATLDRLIELARTGATIVFERQLPTDVPGLFQLEERRGQQAELTGALQFEATTSDGIQQADVGQGRLLMGESVPAMLSYAQVQRERMADHAGIQFVRRTHAEGHHYFIRNAGESALDGWITLAVKAESTVLLDPMTEGTGIARQRTDTQGRTEIFLQLNPGESIILRTFDRPVQGSPWKYRPDYGPPVFIEGTWEVDFVQGGPALPAPFRSAMPADWSAQADEDAQRFAGTARYSIRFDAPVSSGAAGSTDSFLLDLGEVASSARVRLNGRLLGELIAHPFHIETGPLQAEGNVLEIEVTNVAANRIRDLDRRGVVWRKFYDINFVNIDYQAFDASRWPLRPSGLLGPVRLFPLRGP